MRFTYKMAKLFANSGDPDQTLHSAASDLGLQCLLITLLWVSQLQWVKCRLLLFKASRLKLIRSTTELQEAELVGSITDKKKLNLSECKAMFYLSIRVLLR